MLYIAACVIFDKIFNECSYIYNISYFLSFLIRCCKDLESYNSKGTRQYHLLLKENYVY